MKKKFSFRTELVLLAMFFILFVLGLIYFLQTHFLEDFYRSEKIKTLESTAMEIEESLGNTDFLGEVLDEISIENEVCVRIISDNVIVDEMNQNNVCALRRLSFDQINEIAEETIDNNGAKLFEEYQLFKNHFRPSDQHEESPIPNNAYIYALMSSYNDDPVLILASSLITPLAATISTIKSQFYMIAFVVLLATILLTSLLSYFVIKPIRRITEEADSLPKGNYHGDEIEVFNKELSNLNDTLKDANEQILKADKAKKELLGNVSHDLRTPLTMIVGYGEMIRYIPNENNEENINVIIDEAKRLSTLVDDLIDVSKSESGAIELKKEKCSINELLESIYHQYHNYCHEKGIDLKLELSDDKEVYIDVLRMKQVLYNFVNNALNYSTKEHKEIIIGSEKIDDKLRVFVYDNGLGIKKEDIDLIWDRYYKVDKEHQRHHLGSGIGLSLAKELLELHELNYGVESIENEYSKFYFDI